MKHIYVIYVLVIAYNRNITRKKNRKQSFINLMQCIVYLELEEGHNISGNKKSIIILFFFHFHIGIGFRMHKKHIKLDKNILFEVYQIYSKKTVNTFHRYLTVHTEENDYVFEFK